MTGEIEILQKSWAESKMALSDLSEDDAKKLLKVMILQNIDGSWGDGFVNLIRLELLTKAFPEDHELKEIYRQLYEKCSEWMTKQINESNASYTFEHCFRDEPQTYMHRGDGVHTFYDVNDDKYLKELLRKYSNLENGIKRVVYW